MAIALGAGARRPPDRSERLRHHGGSRRIGSASRERAAEPGSAWPTSPRCSKPPCSPTCRAVVPVLTERLAGRAAAASGVEQLIDALGPLARALRYGDVRATDVGALADSRRRVRPADLRRTAHESGVARRRRCRAAADRLLAVQGALALLDHPARDHEWPAVLHRVADQPGAHGLVQWPRHAAAARCRADRRRRGRATPGAGALRRCRRLRWRRVRRGVPRRLRHGAAPRRRLLGVLDEWVATLPKRRVHRRRAVAAAHVRRVRGGRATPLGQLVAGQGDCAGCPVRLGSRSGPRPPTVVARSAARWGPLMSRPVDPSYRVRQRSRRALWPTGAGRPGSGGRSRAAATLAARARRRRRRHRRTPRRRRPACRRACWPRSTTRRPAARGGRRSGGLGSSAPGVSRAGSATSGATSRRRWSR